MSKIEYEENSLFLQIGTTIKNRYVIRDILGVGGFGITYKAYDKVLASEVAIKEYFPSNLANRMMGDVNVTLRTSSDRPDYEYGMARFLRETQDLAKFNKEKSIVSVYDFFQENNTAYMVMEYLEGCTLKEYLENNDGKVDEEMLVHVTFSLMEALEAVHNAGLVHRDVSPDNVFISSDSSVKLIDFGAAKMDMQGESKTVSVVLKYGYAPIEQYARKTEVGPYTDIYALGATMYKMVTGEAPIEATMRAMDDELIRPSNLNHEIPEYIENVILKAMSVRASDRYASIEEMRQDIISGNAGAIVKQTEKKVNKELAESIAATTETAVENIAPHKDGKKKSTIIVAVSAVALVAIIAVVVVLGGNKKTPSETTTQQAVIEEKTTEKTTAATTEKTTEVTTEATTESTTESNINEGLPDDIIWSMDKIFIQPAGFVGGSDYASFTVGINSEGIYEMADASSGLVWNSLNPDIVSIDSDGYMQYLSEGVAVITATYEGETYGTRIAVIVEDESAYPITITTSVDSVDLALDGDINYDNQMWIELGVEGEFPTNSRMCTIYTTLDDCIIVGSSTEGEHGMSSIGIYPYERTGTGRIQVVLYDSETGEVYGLKFIPTNVY